MSDSGPDIPPEAFTAPPPPSAERARADGAARRAPWWRRRWVTVGEVVGVCALAVAALGYMDAHRERRDARTEKTQEAQATAARAALVLTARASDDGGRLTLAPLHDGQAVQTQRYRFPKAVLDHAMEVEAAQPQIDRDWIAAGLIRAARTHDGFVAGEGALPVGVETTYIEDGETRTDRSLYRLGYRIEKGGLFSGPRVVLQGIALGRRGVPGDLQTAVDGQWERANAQALAQPG